METDTRSNEKTFELSLEGRVVMEGKWGWNLGEAGEWIRKTFVDPSFPDGEYDALLKSAFLSGRTQVQILGNVYELRVTWPRG